YFLQSSALPAFSIEKLEVKSKKESPEAQRARAKAEAIAAILARFDHVLESSKVGIRKPDPRIYAMMSERLDAKPASCIYLDDLGINCKPAAAMGMHAIKVASGEQALTDLSAILGFTVA
ncbi:MAG: HAD-IA family hydrolase, partial [Sphingopyxis sp.]|nr:HAD-IA family hydrolase [Sphingopyxis sp.]